MLVRRSSVAAWLRIARLLSVRKLAASRLALATSAEARAATRSASETACRSKRASWRSSSVRARISSARLVALRDVDLRLHLHEELAPLDAGALLHGEPDDLAGDVRGDLDLDLGLYLAGRGDGLRDRAHLCLGRLDLHTARPAAEIACRRSDGHHEDEHHEQNAQAYEDLLGGAR